MREGLTETHHFETLRGPTREQVVRPWFYYAFLFALVGLSMIGIAEGGTRLAFKYKHSLSGPVDPRSYSLNPYEMVDPNETRNWILRPSTAWSIKNLGGRGAILADAQLEKMTKGNSIGFDDVIFQINSNGFKGPELNRAHDSVRILTLGDSCTFGSLIDKFSYPRTIETWLTMQGVNVEVVNGGVKGYTPRNILFRISQFKELKPDIVTIYVGWNSIFTFDAVRDQRWLQSPLLFQAAWNRLYSRIIGQRSAAWEAYHKEKKPDHKAAELTNIGKYQPAFLKEVELIVREMQAAGSHVVLVTLPGLYSVDKWPSERALEVGHLPLYTDNPFVLGKITQQYNEALRNMARAYHLPIIDLEAWARKTFQTSDVYFVDSVHLTEEGQQMIGEYMASKLLEFYQSQLTKGMWKAL